MIPKCAHKGPDKREAEEDLTTEENVGDMMVDTETAVMRLATGGRSHRARNAGG